MRILNNFLEKKSVNDTKNISIAAEFNHIIILLIIIRVVIVLFAVYCGYYFFYSYVKLHVNNENMCVILAILFSLFVEFFGASFIDKFFKFILKKQIPKSIALLIASIIFYSISFYSSTNGMALKQYEKTDKTSYILENNNIKKDNINKICIDKINEIKQNNELIKNNPGGWNGGKRNILTDNQLNVISNNNKLIYEIRRENETNTIKIDSLLNKEVNKNNVIAKSESIKYYNFVFFIMLFSIIISFLIRFFKYRIYVEVDEILSKNERTSNIISNINDIIWNTVINRTAELNSIILNEFNRSTLSVNKIDLVKESQNNIKRVTGFKSTLSTNDTNQTLNVINKTDVNNEKIHNIKKCLYCDCIINKKHWNAKFCSDEHRVKYWENKNEKTFYYKSKNS